MLYIVSFQCGFYKFINFIFNANKVIIAFYMKALLVCIFSNIFYDYEFIFYLGFSVTNQSSISVTPSTSLPPITCSGFSDVSPKDTTTISNTPLTTQSLPSSTLPIVPNCTSKDSSTSTSFVKSASKSQPPKPTSSSRIQTTSPTTSKKKINKEKVLWWDVKTGTVFYSRYSFTI